MTNLGHFCISHSFYKSSFSIIGTQKYVALIKTNKKKSHKKKTLESFTERGLVP